MRNRRAFFFLLLSIMSGMAALIAYYGSVQKAGQVVAEPIIETTPVVMAVADLSPGKLIESSQLEVIDWPSQYVPVGALQTPAEVADRIPRRTIAAGEPILDGMLLEEGRRSGLTALIEPNHRAMSVKADAVVGVGGFIQPGSRVDVLAQLRNIDQDKGAMPYCRTILQNVKVLAIDQNYEPSTTGAAAALASVVTLEVDPGEAQMLAYASAEGTLQLALRNEQDENLVDLRTTGPRDFLDKVRAKPKRRKKVAKAPRNSIESIRGSNMSKEFL
jgi:pilus assembly protein CpaB